MRASSASRSHKAWLFAGSNLRNHHFSRTSNICSHQKWRFPPCWRFFRCSQTFTQWYVPQYLPSQVPRNVRAQQRDQSIGSPTAVLWAPALVARTCLGSFWPSLECAGHEVHREITDLNLDRSKFKIFQIVHSSIKNSYIYDLHIYIYISPTYGNIQQFLAPATDDFGCEPRMGWRQVEQEQLLKLGTGGCGRTHGSSKTPRRDHKRELKILRQILWQFMDIYGHFNFDNDDELSNCRKL